MENLNVIESEILVWIQNHIRFEIMDNIMPGISAINNAGIIAILTVLILVLWKKYRCAGLAAFASIASECVIINLILKPLVHRTRPFYVNESLQLLGHIPTDYSFPSGHTGSAFAVSTVMLLCMPKKYGVTATVISALIAFSRLYNGAHYPTDVLIAMMIGIITGVLSAKYAFPKITQLVEKRTK